MRTRCWGLSSIPGGLVLWSRCLAGSSIPAASLKSCTLMGPT